MANPAFKTLIVAAGLAALVSCGADRAELAVALGAPPSVTPLVFHGSCFAGFDS